MRFIKRESETFHRIFHDFCLLRLETFDSETYDFYDNLPGVFGLRKRSLWQNSRILTWDFCFKILSFSAYCQQIYCMSDLFEIFAIFCERKFEQISPDIRDMYLRTARIHRLGYLRWESPFHNLFWTTRPWRLNISTFGYLMKNAFPEPDIGGAARVAPDLPTESPFSVTAYVADYWAHHIGDIGWIEKQGRGAWTLDISTRPCMRWVREASWSKIPAWLSSEWSQLRYRERRLRRESHRAGRMIRSDETLDQNVRDFSSHKRTRSDYWHDPICFFDVMHETFGVGSRGFESACFGMISYDCWSDYTRLPMTLHGIQEGSTWIWEHQMVRLARRHSSTGCFDGGSTDVNLIKVNQMSVNEVRPGIKRPTILRK